MDNLINQDEIKSIELTQNYFLINWHLTEWCNYNCPYCCNVQRKDKPKFIPEKEIENRLININDKIIKKVDQNILIFLKLIGGEVSFYNWIKLLDKVERLDKITMVTNFSQKLEYYQDLYKYCRKRNISLILLCSYHEENKDYFKKSIDLYKWCLENGFSRPSIRLMVGKNFDISLIDKYKQNGITPNLSKIRDANNKVLPLPEDVDNKLMTSIFTRKAPFGKLKVTYKDNNVEYFKNEVSLTNYIQNNGFDPTGFVCSAGTTTLYIDDKGNVTKGGCRYLFDKYLGNIVSDDIEIPTENIICRLNENNTGERKYCSLCWNVNLYRRDD